jgi:Rel/ankyrin family protein
VKVQLKRPSDGATSDPLDFEMLPLNEGRRGFWNIQRELKKRSATTDLFQQLLEVDSDEQQLPMEEKKVHLINYNSNNDNYNSLPLQNEVVVLDTPIEEDVKPVCGAIDDKTMHWLENAEFVIDNSENNQNLLNQSEDDKTLNDLLEQVAELDVIYQDHQLRKQQEENFDQVLPKYEQQQMETDFDDAATYSSLQKAFKHPIVFTDAPPLPPKSGYISDGTGFDLILPPIVINPATPDLFFREDEKLPPLPPKRAKKISESGDKENKVGNQEESVLVRNNSTRSLTPRPQSQPIVIKSADLRRSPSHKLPPKVPPKSQQQAPINISSNTLPKQKKPGFFSKIFNRRKSKGGTDLDMSVTDSIGRADIDMDQVDNNNEEDPGFDDAVRGSIRSTKSLKSPEHKKPKMGKPVGRSVSSVSGKRPHLTPDIIHIPLKGDSSNSLPLHQSGSGTHLSLPGNDFYERASTASLHPIDRKTLSALELADVPLQDGDMELVAIADAQSLRNLCESGEHGIILDPSVDLTEAEHYALYTTMAPHATESEFDENSCYYQPIEAGQILTPAEVARRLNENNF